MRNLSLSLSRHFKEQVTTLATCWRISRRDGVTLGFTDHDKSFILDNLPFDSISGFTPTNVETGSQLTVDNLDVTGYCGERQRRLWQSKITEEDLLGGKYDFAEVEIFLVDYLKPKAGKLVQKRGVLGEVTIKKNIFSAEIRGLTQFLSQTMCEEYLPHCRAILGDKRCRFNLKQKGFTVNAIVTEVKSRQSFVARHLDQPRSWFSLGYLTWRSGKNITIEMEVKEFVGCTITLALPMPYSIQEGDEFTIVAGCDKSSKTCIEKFNNIINFRGEPDLPGTDKILTTAGTMRR